MWFKKLVKVYISAKLNLSIIFSYFSSSNYVIQWNIFIPKLFIKIDQYSFIILNRER